MKDSKKIETVLALHYVYCAVSVAMDDDKSPEVIAGQVHMTCCNVEEGTDMVAKIKADELIPNAVARWLIKIFETLPHKEADQAVELVSAMLIGATVYDRVRYLDCYNIL